MLRTLEKHGINNPKEQWRHIEYIRHLDRKAQGITSKHEKEAKEALSKKEILFDGKFIIVQLPHNKSSLISDELYGSYKNLLVLCEEKEVNFFGNGLMCEALHKKF